MGTTEQYAILLALLVFSCMQLLGQHHLCHGAPTFNCREDERKALLQFKDGVQHPSVTLSSWVGMSCCSWPGVKCSNRTGRVIQLDLRGSEYSDDRIIIGDEINPCLLALQELEYLDLSNNNFSGAQIPKFIGSFKRLRHLNLSDSHLVGSVPPELGNLSSLRYLDVSWNSFYYDVSHRLQLEIDDDSWLSSLSSLYYLDLTSVKLRNFSRALQSVGMLPLLSELHMAECTENTLHGDDLPLHVNFTSLKILVLFGNNFNTTLPSWLFEISSLKHLDLSWNSFMGHVPGAMANMTSLEYLDLSGNNPHSNNFNTTLPSWLFEISSLKHLDLSWNSFMGHVPNAIANLTSLEFLNLSGNNLLGGASLSAALSKLTNLTILSLHDTNLKGDFPHWLNGDHKKLKHLDLSDSQLNGTLTERRLGQLSSLVHLDLAENSFSGVITDAHFRNLTRLESLDLSHNSLEIRIRPDWTPPRQLNELRLDDCVVGEGFPAWLRKIENISVISMSNAEIADIIPDWFWNFSLKASVIELSNNMIQGKRPASLQHLNNLLVLDLSNTSLEGPFPQLPEKLQQLYLSNTSLNGGIPSSVCKLKELSYLDLSGNNLSGEIPDCFDSTSSFSSVDLSNNKLSGTFPSSICSFDLVLLKLERNNLSGPLPLSLQNSTNLRSIDLGNNKFSGSIPTWLGSTLTKLKVLRLKSNFFVGQIPRELGTHPSLRIIDLSYNMLSGPIPQSFANLSAMSYIYNSSSCFGCLVDVWTKGRDQEYDLTKIPLASIDLSNNNLSGQIPEALTILVGLRNLNLSNNHLTGAIPMSIMGLRYLESLDLSFNNITGEIPQAMADLNFLSSMNFSFNRLYGRIPTGGQFDNHPDASIYMGNMDLCGFPLNINCQGNVTKQPSHNIYNDKKVEDFESLWCFVSVALGFVTGFWVFVGSLMLKIEWRIGYYRYIDHAYDKLYAFVVVNLACIWHR